MSAPTDPQLPPTPQQPRLTRWVQPDPSQPYLPQSPADRPIRSAISQDLQAEQRFTPPPWEQSIQQGPHLQQGPAFQQGPRPPQPMPLPPAARQLANPYPPRVPDLSQPAPMEPAPNERVAVGLAMSLLAVAAGILATVLLWKIGFIASVTPFLLAILAVALYARGAGAPARRGAVPLVGVIVLGIIACLFAIIGTDLWVAYPDYAGEVDMTRFEFVVANLLNGKIWALYTKDLSFFLAFAALGIIGTVVRLVKAARTS